MLHAFGGDEFVGNLADDAGLSAHDENLQTVVVIQMDVDGREDCLLYTSPSPRDRQKSRMPSSA